MLEFTLKRIKEGKKSRWSNKYPRKKILNKGNEKVAGWYFHNWNADNYHYFSGNLHRFLIKSIGRPVDKVFSEFLKRCKKGTERYNLREKFYRMFKAKDTIDYTGGFYLSNGIINFKKKRKEADKVVSSVNYSEFNIQNLPVKNRIYSICKKASDTHTKQYLGEFYIYGNHFSIRKTKVYVVTRADYYNSYFCMDIANIVDIGIGLWFNMWYTNQRTIIEPQYIPCYTYKHIKSSLPYYVFIVK